MGKTPQADRPPVVVAGASQTGVVLMRDLARRNVEVCCIDCSPTQVGFRTVYGKAHLCPNPDTAPDAWREFMIRLAREIGRRPVLMSSADQFVSAISEHAAALEPHYIFRPASMVTQALLATKKRQYEFAAANGLPVPRTRFVQSIEELRQFCAEARFPCLLKPVHFREWSQLPADHPFFDRKIAVAQTAEEMEANYRLAETASRAVVVQEIIEGPDDAKLVYLSCYGRGAKRLGSCIVREIRTEPIHFGSASVTVPVEDPETEALCDNFLRAVHYEGLCELELKRDSRDGRVKLIEANPRYTVTSDAAVYAGIDLGWLHYLDLIGETVEPARPNGRFFHHIVLRRDVACFRSYLQAGLVNWGGLARTYTTPHFYDLDLRDWRIAIDTLKVIAIVLIYPFYRRVFPKKR